MLDRLRQLLPALPAEVRAQLRTQAKVNSVGFDPWGMNVETSELAVQSVRWLYDRYFRVEAHGVERLPEGRVLLVPNHSGQIPFDGMLVGLAVFLYGQPPRIVRGMIERWIVSLPFVSTLAARVGFTVGDPSNCAALLEREQAILVFPEGVRGSGKTYWERYRLQRFGTGFMRIALETGTPIVPVAVVGAEETYPSVHNAASLAKLLGLPYLPVTPLFPLLGPLGLLPLPVKIDIHFGAPRRFEAAPDASDGEIEQLVAEVQRDIDGLLQAGLARRPLLQALQRLPGGRS